MLRGPVLRLRAVGQAAMASSRTFWHAGTLHGKGLHGMSRGEVVCSVAFASCLGLMWNAHWARDGKALIHACIVVKTDKKVLASADVRVTPACSCAHCLAACRT